MSKLLTLKNVLILLFGVVIIFQFFQIDRSVPVIDPSSDVFAVLEASEEVQQLVQAACYDCHSHKTDYPWYSYVAPVSWWIKDHIEHGRKHLNFSKWTSYEPKKAAHKLEECFEEVAKEVMPLESYTWAHAKARLTEAQRAKLVSWFKQSKRKIESKTIRP